MESCGPTHRRYETKELVTTMLEDEKEDRCIHPSQPRFFLLPREKISTSILETGNMHKVTHNLLEE